MPAAPKGKPEQETAHGFGPIPDFKTIPVIGDAERDALLINLTESLREIWKGADGAISFSNKQKADAYIWQTIPDEDTEFLAKGMIRVGMVNSAAAWAVRGISNAHALLRAGLILGPRFLATFQFYAEHGGLWFR